MEDEKENSSSDVGGMTDRDEKVARSVLSSIERQFKTRVVNLSYEAVRVLEDCVDITCDGIEVCLGCKEDEGDSVGVTDGVCDVKKESKAGIHTAMKTLAMISFREEGDESGSDRARLEQVLHVWAERILSSVLRPAIVAVRDGLEGTKKAGSGVGVVKYETAESTVEKSSLFGRHGHGHRNNVASNNDMIYNNAHNHMTRKKKKATVKVLQWKTDIVSVSKGKGDLGWWTSLLDFLQKVIRFVCDNVFAQCEDPDMSKELYIMFGSAILGEDTMPSKNVHGHSLRFDCDIMEHGTKCPMMKMLGRLVWDHCVPNTVNMEALEWLENQGPVLKDSILSLDKFFMDLHLCAHHIALVDYSDNYDKIYCDKVRMHILARGRKILLEGDYHNAKKVGTNLHDMKQEETPEYLDKIGVEKQDMSIFIFEECGISQVASELMDLCIQTMDLAVESRTAVHKLLPPTLYRATRELLDLYHAIIPTVHGDEIESIPRVAALFHNDCCFLAHRLLTFGLEYNDRFPVDAQGRDSDSALKHICTFLDLVPIFRETAERTMNAMIERQKIQIAEIVSRRLEYFSDALASNEGVAEWIDAESAVTAGLYHLRHLSQTWKSVLPYQVYCTSMGSIADDFLMLFLERVLAAKDISVQACHFVHGLFQNALRGVVDVFGTFTNNSLEGSKYAEKSCSVYHKFAAIGKFMNMRLVDVNVALTEGVFQSVTGAELSRLLLAVFEDTESRRKLLRMLESN